MSYEDIINYKYEKSKTHKWMSNDKRAFQFAPFSALTGYEESIEKTARQYEEEILDLEKGSQIHD